MKFDILVACWHVENSGRPLKGGPIHKITQRQDKKSYHISHILYLFVHPAYALVAEDSIRVYQRIQPCCRPGEVLVGILGDCGSVSKHNHLLRLEDACIFVQKIRHEYKTNFM